MSGGGLHPSAISQPSIKRTTSEVKDNLTTDKVHSLGGQPEQAPSYVTSTTSHHVTNSSKVAPTGAKSSRTDEGGQAVDFVDGLITQKRMSAAVKLPASATLAQPQAVSAKGKQKPVHDTPPKRVSGQHIPNLAVQWISVLCLILAHTAATVGCYAIVGLAAHDILHQVTSQDDHNLLDNNVSDMENSQLWIPALSANSIPLINAEVYNHPNLKAIIDSGSEICIINESLVPKGLAYTPWRRIEIKTANGSTLPILGTLNTTIKVKGTTFKIEFVVARTFPYKVLLGMDFLRKYQAVLDLSERKLKLGNVTVPLKHQSGSTVVAHLRLDRTVNIPPKSEYMCVTSHDAQANTKVRNQPALMESVPSLREQHGVMSARALVTIQKRNKMPVKLVNPLDHSVVLQQGTVVATLQLVQHPTVALTTTLNSGQDVTSPAFFTAPTSMNVDAFLSSINIDKAVLSAEQHQQLSQLLLKHQHVFAVNTKGPGRSPGVKHKIDTQGHAPINQAPYRVSPAQNKEISDNIDVMLKNKVIRRSRSPWASPVVMVLKPDGSTRFCVDYRKVNAVTRKDSYPLPRIDDTLDALNGMKYFTTLDLASGYWQIEIEEGDIEKTAFITRQGLFEFEVMPFGLCNAPATFQRTMDLVLAGLKWHQCLVYMDDIIIFSATFDQHLNDIESVFQRLEEHKLTLRVDKCHFAKQELKFLGHIVSAKGIKPNPALIQAVERFPTPHDITTVRRFLGLTGYYRKFIEGFAAIATPLHLLLTKQASERFVWTEEADRAFKVLKQKLTTAPVLAFPDFKHPFILTTDASDTGIAAILSQEIGDKKVVVAYASRSLDKHERNYATTEKECLAIVWATDYFRPYLIGQHFIVITDHKALKWLFSMRGNNGKLMRWSLKLQEFDFTIVPHKGVTIPHVDALSRHLPVDDANTSTPVLVVKKKKAEKQQKILKLAPQQIWKQLQIEDSSLASMWQEAQHAKNTQSTNFVIKHGLLLHVQQVPVSKNVTKTHYQLVVPKKLRPELLTMSHDSLIGGHLGVDKTWRKLRESYWWPKMQSTVAEWIKSCSTCQAGKAVKHRHQGALQSIAPPDTPFHTIGIDFIVKLPETNNGNKNILVIMDYLTKWPEAFPTPDETATTVAKIICDHIVPRHGVPQQLISDRGKAFVGEVMTEVYRLLGIHKLSTSAYHPQTDGLVERFNKTLSQILAKYISFDQRDWDHYISYALFAYRTSVHASTHMTPFYMMYGREARLPAFIAQMKEAPPYTTLTSQGYGVEFKDKMLQIWQQGQENIKLAQKQQQHHHNKKTTPIEYQVGDVVRVENPSWLKKKKKKLSLKWHGPYIIAQKMGPVTYKIKPVRGGVLPDPVHVDRLSPTNEMDRKVLEEQLQKDDDPTNTVAPHVAAPTDPPTTSTRIQAHIPPEPTPAESEPDEYWEVEQIVADRVITRKRRKVQQYKIRWQGFGSEHDSWSDLNDLDCDELIQEYWSQQAPPEGYETEEESLFH